MFIGCIPCWKKLVPSHLGLFHREQQFSPKKTTTALFCCNQFCSCYSLILQVYFQISCYWECNSIAMWLFLFHCVLAILGSDIIFSCCGIIWFGLLVDMIYLCNWLGSWFWIFWLCDLLGSYDWLGFWLCTHFFAVYLFQWKLCTGAMKFYYFGCISHGKL